MERQEKKAPTTSGNAFTTGLFASLGVMTVPVIIAAALLLLLLVGCCGCSTLPYLGALLPR